MHQEITIEGGGVDLDACPTRTIHHRTRLPVCWCGKCRVCGYPKHTATHAPPLGHPPGSAPWGHVFEPEE